MSDKKSTGILVAAMLWIVIIGVIAAAAKYYILPYFDKSLMEETGSDSQYKHTLALSADSFSGYAILRSPVMKKELKTLGIKLDIVDDQADYDARMKALSKKDVQMAVFTIDSFIQAGEKLGNVPGTIVLVIDESKGADAMVAYKDSVASIEDLNHPDAGIVLTSHSPSEFLARTVIAHFNLPLLPESWMIPEDGSEAVYKAFKKADKKEKKAFVLWEPYVSKALDDSSAHIILDSSKLSGYIVDVLVAERTFLKDNPEIVRDVVASYLKAAYAYAGSKDTMISLVMNDAKETGSGSLSRDTASRMVDRIEWKNTMENYGYFGLTGSGGAQGNLNLEDMIANIRDVLIKTGALSGNFLEGKEHTLFYAAVLSDLKAANFHPAKKVDVIQGLGSGTGDLDTARKRAALSALSDKEWAALKPVGSLKIPPIMFARGTSRINIGSARDLDKLSRQLASFPQYYLRVVGHTRSEGDLSANMKLAEDRAKAAYNHLVSAGVSPARIRSEAAKPSGTDGDNQSVQFILVEAPF